VFTAINTRVVAKFKAKYPNINCGTSLKKQTTPKFPYVQISKLQNSENARTFDNGLNAITSGFQIEVYSNSSESICEEISNYIADIMTGNMAYTMIGDPYPDYDSTDEYRYIARYQRVIGKDDYMKY
jgi:hypothetical protein